MSESYDGPASSVTVSANDILAMNMVAPPHHHQKHCPVHLQETIAAMRLKLLRSLEPASATSCLCSIQSFMNASIGIPNSVLNSPISNCTSTPHSGQGEHCQQGVVEHVWKTKLKMMVNNAIGLRYWTSKEEAPLCPWVTLDVIYLLPRCRHCTDPFLLEKGQSRSKGVLDLDGVPLLFLQLVVPEQPIRNGPLSMDFKMFTPFSLPRQYSQIRCCHEAKSVLSSIGGLETKCNQVLRQNAGGLETKRNQVLKLAESSLGKTQELSSISKTQELSSISKTHNQNAAANRRTKSQEQNAASNKKKCSTVVLAKRQNAVYFSDKSQEAKRNQEYAREIKHSEEKYELFTKKSLKTTVLNVPARIISDVHQIFNKLDLTQEKQRNKKLQTLCKLLRKVRRQAEDNHVLTETGNKPRVPNRSTVISATSSEGTDADDEDVKTKSDEDETYRYKIRVHNEEDVEMKDVEVKESNKGEEKVTNAVKKESEKTSKAKDDTNKSELPPSSSSLSVSAGVELFEPRFELDDQEWVEMGSFLFIRLEIRFMGLLRIS
nr:hypothetical protein [Tanacetum cinerariifolium]